MESKLLKQLKTKTREEWSAQAKEVCTNSRIWVQENGEKAAALAFLIGVCLVVFFKIIITLIVLCALAASLVWTFAPSRESEAVSGKEEQTTGRVEQDAKTAPNRNEPDEKRGESSSAGNSRLDA